MNPASGGPQKMLANPRENNLGNMIPAAMKMPFVTMPRLCIAGFALLVHSAQAQGPLAPPGPPAPMMKTLQEMEPRTHITAAGYTITTPGSYYLTANLNGGGTQNGITVQASGVTIDLRGFSIENCQTGITTTKTTSIRNVVVANGIVRDCASTGVDLSGAAQCRLEGVMVSANGANGAAAGAGSLFTLCTASGNGGLGMVLGNNGTVFRCVVQNNAAGGIIIDSNCQATENTITGNGSGAGQAGLIANGSNNRVEGNSANHNNSHGFLIIGAGNLVVRNNACSNTVADYQIASGNNYGQILVAPGAGFASPNAWANFGCTALPVNCQTAAECDDANSCTEDACVANACVSTPIPGCGPCQTGAECDDQNACTDDICANGVCSHNPIPGCGTPVCGNGILENGETCDDENVINGDGCSSSCQTEGCLSASECPGTDTDCQYRTCTQGVCGFTFQPYGVPVTSQVSGDCMSNVCDGSGAIVSIPEFADFPPDDGNQCTSNLCVGGNPTYQNLPSGTPCSQNGGTECDGNGMCISNAACGDGVMEGPETCDDMNQSNGDGCSGACTVEPGYQCSGSPSVCALNSYALTVVRNGDGSGTVSSFPAGINCGAACSANYNSGTMVTLTAAPHPGSVFAGWSGGGCSGTGTCAVTMDSAKSVAATFIQSAQFCATAPNGTACDDGNACTQSDTCQSGVCTGASVDNDQDGFTACAGDCDDTNPNIYPGHVELCDGVDNNCDGMINEEVCGDSIDNDCDGQVDEGCPVVCGNGIVEAGETCDDANTLNGDGCSAVCTSEVGFFCSGSPSVCTTICGDGAVGSTEACDDDNINSGDGCSSDCTVEPGYACTGTPSVCFQE